MSRTVDEPTITATKPTPISGVARTEFISALQNAVKGALQTSYSDFFTGIRNFLKAFTSIHTAVNASDYNIQEQAWILLNRSLSAAVLQTLRSNKNELESRQQLESKITETLTKLLDSGNTEFQSSLFENPRENLFFQKVARGLEKTLHEVGVDKEKTDKICKNLAEEFTIALDIELRENRNLYHQLTDYFISTLTDHTHRLVRSWKSYRHQLIAASRRPVLDLGVPEKAGKLEPQGDDAMAPLEELFVWPRAAYLYESREQEKNPVRQHYLVNLWCAIDAWRRRAWADDKPLIVISGEAGVGKSSFVRMVAAEWAKQNCNPLYCPLDRVPYDGRNNAWQAITEFAQNNEPNLLGDPLENINSENPLLLIIDGLDELSSSARSGSDLARQFMDDIWTKIQSVNTDRDRKLFVCLAGRPNVTALHTQHLIGQKQPLQVLGLSYIPSDEEPHFQVTIRNYSPMVADPNCPGSRTSQYAEWWARFLRAVGEEVPVNGVPEIFEKELNSAGETFFGELLDQPLLSFFLGMLYISTDLDLNAITTRRQLYYEIFHHFRRRQLTKARDANNALAGLLEDASKYQMVLELVAEAAWHDGDRSVGRDRVVSRLSSREALGALRKITKKERPAEDAIDAAAGGILTSFMMTVPDVSAPGRLEFAHKSFREFLTAERLCRLISFYLSKSNDEWYAVRDDFLYKWFSTTSVSSISSETCQFLREGLVASYRSYPGRLKTIQRRWEEIFSNVVDTGFPASYFVREEGATFANLERQSKNATEATLAVLNAILFARNNIDGGSKPIRQKASIANREKQYDKLALSKLLLHLNDIGESRRVFWNMLSWLNAPYQQILDLDFIKGLNFEGAKINGLGAVYKRFGHTLFLECDLRDLRVQQCEFRLVHFSGADIERGRFSRSSFIVSDFEDAKLYRADLSGCDFYGCSLLRSDLRFASLADARVRASTMAGADLEGANIQNLQVPENVLDKAYNIDKAKGEPVFLAAEQSHFIVPPPGALKALKP